MSDDESSGDEFQIQSHRNEKGASQAGHRGPSNVTKLPIQIRTMDGKTYKIDAKTDWDVERLKAEFEKWHGGSAATCSLYFKAKKLQDNNTLQSYKINAGKLKTSV